jgi:hypothetical protein
MVVMSRWSWGIAHSPNSPCAQGLFMRTVSRILDAMLTQAAPRWLGTALAPGTTATPVLGVAFARQTLR